MCARSRLGAGGSAGARCCRSGSCIILALEALRWLPDSSCLTRPHSYHMRVNCAGNAVLHLSIQLWEHISIIDACLLDISHSCLLHNVADKESLYSLILHSSMVQERCQLSTSARDLVQICTSHYPSSGINTSFRQKNTKKPR